ncbi:MAG: hypothetical protein M3O64_01095 [Chloroflexota bacterium]|nr:hypothetical protein [Chloroflexota bacterium]
MDEHELAWAAGFFDGDGWAALSQQKGRLTGQARAQINQSSLDGVPAVLTRFHDAVGVGRVSGPTIEEGREPLYRWVASSRTDVRQTGRLILPWLSGQKRRQFNAAVGLSLASTPLASFAWAAGLFDAEGCTSLSDRSSRKGYKAIEASVTQGGGGPVPEELARFMECVAIGRVNGPYEQEGANEPVYRWRLHTVDDVRSMLHVLLPWLGAVKRNQALAAIAVIDRQPTLPRGRVEWGSHKTHCIHGHDYASTRIRPHVGRGVGIQRRDNKQCLQCTREQARARRIAGDRQRDGDEATC